MALTKRPQKELTYCSWTCWSSTATRQWVSMISSPPTWIILFCPNWGGAEWVSYGQALCWTKKQGSDIIVAKRVYNKLHRHLLSAPLRGGWHVLLSQSWAAVSILIFLWSLTCAKSILLLTYFPHPHPHTLPFRAADRTEMRGSFLFYAILYDPCEKNKINNVC